MVSRRQVLAGLGAVAVYGFNPVSRTWIASAEAASAFDHLPHLDGTVSTDPASLAPYATDAGSAIHDTPVAVLKPGSVQDIAKMVRFCRRYGITVGPRGQGHTTFGQSQVKAGLVVDMATLNKIHSIQGTRADIEAGATWRMLVDAATPLGLTPPVLTGYIKLSIAGTLSVAGVPARNRHGLQIDHVQELEIVTGEGEIKICSPHQNRELFYAALGGLGQFGIITRAVVDMVKAFPMARSYVLPYTDNALFFNDLRTLLARDEADEVYGMWTADGAGGLVYLLNVAKYFEPHAPPDDNQLLRGLAVPPAAASPTDQTYQNYVERIDVVIDFFTQIGLWEGVLHPWFDVWLGDRVVEKYVGETIHALTPEDVGPTGFVLLFPQKRAKIGSPFLPLPDCSEWVFLFDILTANATPGPDPVFQSKMLARNRALFEKARNLGGTRYSIGSVEFDKKDWIQQYGLNYFLLKALKERFDPDALLAPGVGIFK
ncbi:MAG: FAD-binding protein [Pseudomonadota bacterium]